MAKVPIKLKIQDTENVIFEGEVERITSFNEIGPFDIYPMHANFISILRQQLTLYKNKEKIKEIKFDQAIMKVKKDLVNIFLGLEVLLLEESNFNEKNPTKANPQKSS